MTVLPRAATGPEIGLMRKTNQHAKLFMTVHAPDTVYTARLATVPTSNDSVVQIAYNSGSGAGFSNILADQTLLVGSTAGGFDYGMGRVRTLSGLGSSTGTMDIGETSEIQFASGAYLTVLNEILLNRRDPRVLTDGTIFMDWDIAYSDQHAHCASIPVLGPPAVKWLRGATVDVLFDASNSWCVNNSIVSYSWAAPGASATSGLATATPTMTYNATGQYRVACTIVNSDGVSSTGYRMVFIISETSPAPLLIHEFNLSSFTGDDGAGNWSAQVTMWGEANLSVIRDRAMVILHSRDWWGATSNDETPIGMVADRENIRLVGNISVESDKLAALDKYSSLSFTISGPAWWLSKPTSFPLTIKDKNQTVNKWTRFFGATARATTWHVWNWRTTGPRMMDIYPMDSSWRGARFDAPGGQSIWEQIKTILKNNLIAAPSSDRYGRVFMQRQQNTLDAAARSSIPTVMTLTRGDWTNNIDFDRRQVHDVGYVNFSGVAWDGVTPTPMFSLAPGHVPERLGAPDVVERLVLQNDHTIVNTFCGAYHGWRNNPYPRFTIEFGGHNPMVDIAPYQYVAVNIASGDTVRGVVETSLRVIPRQIRHKWNTLGQFFTTEMDVEVESPILPAITGDTPATPPPIPVIPPVIPPIPPSPVPTPTGDAREVWFATSNYPNHAVYWSGDYFAGGQPTWNKITTLPPGTPLAFNVATDGSILYMQTDYPNQTIYACSNPKATTPSWSSILGPGDPVLLYTAQEYFGYVCGPMVVSGSRLITTVALSATPRPQWAYGEFSGSWTWYNEPGYNVFRPLGVGLDTWLGATPAVTTLYVHDRLEVMVDSISMITGGAGYEVWHRAGQRRYMIIQHTTTGYIAIHFAGASSNEIDMSTMSASQQVDDTKIRGAQAGVQVYVVNAGSGDPGALWLSDDGTTFNKVGSSWGPGWVEDAASGGGGSLVWVLKTIPGSGVPTRLYYRNGTVLRDMTGNFWSLAGAGDQPVVGMGLVY
jgi:hypothetical protein